MTEGVYYDPIHDLVYIIGFDPWSDKYFSQTEFHYMEYFVYPDSIKDEEDIYLGEL